MRVMLDTNVVLDVLLKREPFVQDSVAVWRAIDEGRLVGHVSATSITDIFYVARRLTDLETAHEAVRICLEAFEICPVDRQVLDRANHLSGRDFEDNVQIACAEALDLEAIVTRNTQDFAFASMVVFTPTALLDHLQSVASDENKV
ncbi:MAG: PIN domain-containing protein [Anaerolineae bacterium]|nr:PIN domain-containing protein [Anaerolineae bacterium]